MAVSQTLNPSNEVNALQSFTYPIAGRSLLAYYASGTYQGGAAGYILTTTVGVSRPSSIVTVGGAPLEVNFDITVNKPTIFAGIGYIDFKISDPGAVNDGHVHFRIINVKGVVETVLATLESEHMTTTGSLTGKITFTLPRKTYGVGDLLRLETTIADPTTNNVTLSFDPQTAGSELILTMPVVNTE